MNVLVRASCSILRFCLALVAFVLFVFTAATAQTGTSRQGGDARSVSIEAARNKSSSLSPAERQQARQLFSSSFTLYQQGDFENARSGFKRGLAIDPADVTAHFYMGETLTRLGDSAAKEHYELAVALSPHSPDGIRATSALERQQALERQRNNCTSDARRLEKVGAVLVQCSGLEWTHSDNGADITWSDARRWCAQKGLGWRLPTRSELESLYDPRAKNESCKGVWECNISPLFRITGTEFWTSEFEPDKVWQVNLGFGSASPRARLTAMGQTAWAHERALCVRRP